MVNTELELRHQYLLIDYNILNIVVNTEPFGAGSFSSGNYNILNIVVNTEQIPLNNIKKDNYNILNIWSIQHYFSTTFPNSLLSFISVTNTSINLFGSVFLS